MKTEIKIGFIGCGNIAHQHMRFLKSLGLSVAAVCDLSPLRANIFKKKYGIPAGYSDFNVMIDHEKIDVVHIVTEPGTHYKLTMAVLEKCCHVVVEKPLCFTHAEAEAISRKAKEKGVEVCVDYTRVFNPLVLEAKEKINTGVFGKIVRLEYDYDDPCLQTRTWFKSMKGGVMGDLLPHPISVFLSFAPDLEIEHVFTSANDSGPKQLVVNLTSKEIHAIMKLSLNIKPLRNRLDIYCEKGRIRIDFRNLFSAYVPQWEMPDILNRVLGTFVEGLQILWGTLYGIFSILSGRLHPYSGLDEILKRFYGHLQKGVALDYHFNGELKVVGLTEEVVNKLEAVLLTQDYGAEEHKNVSDGKSDILVTGGTGFIGKYLVKSLVGDFEKKVRVLSRGAGHTKDLPREVEFCQGNMKDPTSLERSLRGVHTVYHCAAAMSGDWAEFHASTVEGTENLLKTIEISRVKRFIYVSSLSVIDYVRLSNGDVLDENSPVEQEPQKRGFYTQAKVAAELKVKEFSLRHPDIQTVIVRPGLVYGKENNKILSNAGIRFGHYLISFVPRRRTFGLIYVQNLVDFLCLLADKNVVAGSVYHVVDQDDPQSDTLLREYGDLIGQPITPLYIPVFVWRIAFAAVDFFLPMLRAGEKSYFGYRYQSNRKSLVYDVAKAKNEIGWSSKLTWRKALSLS